MHQNKSIFPNHSLCQFFHFLSFFSSIVPAWRDQRKLAQRYAEKEKRRVLRLILRVQCPKPRLALFSFFLFTAFPWDKLRSVFLLALQCGCYVAQRYNILSKSYVLRIARKSNLTLFLYTPSLMSIELSLFPLTLKKLRRAVGKSQSWHDQIW